MAYTWNTATKTAWATVDAPSTSDFNMINNNLLYLKQQEYYRMQVTLRGVKR